jgi:hypothetical protein
VSNSNSSQLNIPTVVLRSIAGGIGAGIGIGVSLVVLLVIGALQGLGLIGGPTWEGDSVWAYIIAAMLVCGIWGVGTLKWRPSMGRALFAGIGGFTLVVVVQMFLRWLLGLTPWDAGAVSLFGGFAAGFSALWGMGAARRGYNLVETSGIAVEHDLEAPVDVVGAFSPITVGGNLLHFSRTKIIPIVRPLLAPLALALGVAMVGFVVVIVLGAISPVVQTNDTSAAATTPAGYMVGVTMFGGPVSKLAFFLFIALFILGGIASIGLGLALFVNALSSEVKDAQKMAPVPLDFSEESKVKGPIGHTINFFIRLRKFFAEWLADITGGALRSIIR